MKCFIAGTDTHIHTHATLKQQRVTLRRQKKYTTGNKSLTATNNKKSKCSRFTTVTASWSMKSMSQQKLQKFKKPNLNKRLYVRAVLRGAVYQNDSIEEKNSQYGTNAEIYLLKAFS